MLFVCILMIKQITEHIFLQYFEITEANVKNSKNTKIMKRYSLQKINTISLGKVD